VLASRAARVLENAPALGAEGDDEGELVVGLLVMDAHVQHPLVEQAAEDDARLQVRVIALAARVELVLL